MSKLTSVPRWLIAVIVSILPTLTTFLLTRFYLHADLFNFVPVYWNDPTWYWHQTLSFSRVGFASGYYLVNEVPARLPFFKFSSAGPLFPVIYGAIGHFTGWFWTTGIVFNILLLAVATLMFVYLARLDKTQILLTGAALLTIGPILLFLPSNSQESFHQAGTLILAGLFYRLWMGKISRRLWWTGLLFLLFISLIRFSWVILLPVYFLIDDKPISIRRMSIAIVAGGLSAVIVYLLVSFTSSPGHNVIIVRVGTFGISPLSALQNLSKIAIDNLNTSFLGTTDLQHLNIDHVQGIQIAILGISALVLAFPAREFRSRLTTKPLEMHFHLYNLGLIIILSVVMYISDGFYRIFGLHILLSLLLLIAFRRLALVTVVVIISILMIGTFGIRYRDTILPNLVQDISAIEASRQQLANLIPYEPDADPWCNTLLLPGKLRDNRILYVPAGIGISFFGGVPAPTADNPIRSHYLLLDDSSFQYLSTGYFHVQQLASMRYGVLYRNTDVVCPTNPPQ